MCADVARTFRSQTTNFPMFLHFNLPQVQIAKLNGVQWTPILAQILFWTQSPNELLQLVDISCSLAWLPYINKVMNIPKLMILVQPFLPSGVTRTSYVPCNFSCPRSDFVMVIFRSRSEPRIKQELNEACDNTNSIIQAENIKYNRFYRLRILKYEN